MPKYRNSNATFWVIFKQCVAVAKLCLYSKIICIKRPPLQKEKEKRPSRKEHKGLFKKLFSWPSTGFIAFFCVPYGTFYVIFLCSFVFSWFLSNGSSAISSTVSAPRELDIIKGCFSSVNLPILSPLQFSFWQHTVAAAVSISFRNNNALMPILFSRRRLKA